MAYIPSLQFQLLLVPGWKCYGASVIVNQLLHRTQLNLRRCRSMVYPLRMQSKWKWMRMAIILKEKRMYKGGNGESTKLCLQENQPFLFLFRHFLQMLHVDSRIRLMACLQSLFAPDSQVRAFRRKQKQNGNRTRLATRIGSLGASGSPLFPRLSHHQGLYQAE